MRFSEVVLVVMCFCARACSQPRQPQEAQVPCFFIFGDSLVDNGNNNRIVTLARANYRPYGVDFPQGPTGRFTNGRTFVDVLGNQCTPLINFLFPIFIFCHCFYMKMLDTVWLMIPFIWKKKILLICLSCEILQPSFLVFQLTYHHMQEPADVHCWGESTMHLEQLASEMRLATI